MTNTAHRWYRPLDPECPTNPLRDFWNDPITKECVCADEIAASLEDSHRVNCSHCQEYGAAHIELATE